VRRIGGKERLALRLAQIADAFVVELDGRDPACLETVLAGSVIDRRL
jgi:hypothetical protein